MKLRQILRYIGASTGNMEEGSFRCDANVSVRPVGQAEYGTKVEVKNMNTFHAVRRALEYEVERPDRDARRGERDGAGDARLGRRARRDRVPAQKEHAHDYRYFPEPDLPPLTFTPEQVDEVAPRCPNCPTPAATRFMEQYGLPAQDADLLTARATADYYEAAVAAAARHGRTARG